RTLQDYFFLTIRVTNNINDLLVDANNFELKTRANLKGYLLKNPYSLEEVIFLTPMHLSDSTFPDRAITTWDKCTHKLLLKYFPPSKSNKLKRNIMKNPYTKPRKYSRKCFADVPIMIS
ncbi:hypothetical protein CR513_57601, partial [Mucuna pruriens]